MPHTNVGEKELTEDQLVYYDLPVGKDNRCEGRVDESRVSVELEPVHTSAGGHVARLRVAEDRARLDGVGKRDLCCERRAVVADVSVRDTKERGVSSHKSADVWVRGCVREGPALVS